MTEAEMEQLVNLIRLVILQTIEGLMNTGHLPFPSETPNIDLAPKVAVRDSEGYGMYL